VVLEGNKKKDSYGPRGWEKESILCTSGPAGPVPKSGKGNGGAETVQGIENREGSPQGTELSELVITYETSQWREPKKLGIFGTAEIITWG